MREKVLGCSAAAVLLSAMSVFSADEGWRNVCETRVLPPPVKGIWSAPIDKGAAAFSVDWRDGATGAVSFVRTERGHCIRIAKTTPAGYVVVTAKEPFPVPSGTKLRAYAGCESDNADCEYSYGFLRMYGKKENLAFFSGLGSVYGIGGPKINCIANTPPGMADRKLAHFIADEKTGTNVTAAIVVAGAPSTSLWTKWGVEDFSAASKAWTAMVKARRPPTGAKDSPAMTDAEFDAFVSGEPDHTAKVVRRDGYARLLLDGKQVVPVFFKGCNSEAVKGFYGGAKMSEVGMGLQATGIRLGVTKRQEPGFWSKDGFDVKGAVASIRKSMMRAPKAKYLLGINVSAYPEFTDEHPDEVWLNDKGQKVFGHNCHSQYWLPKKMDPKRHWYWVSNHSTVWRDAVNEQLTRLIDELKRTGLSRLIVGVHLSGYHDGQFSTVHPDYSKPAIEGFRRWLKTKYPTEAALRKAWNDPAVPETSGCGISGTD